jgi:hypothetical protein
MSNCNDGKKSVKLICKGCKKPIVGKARVHTYRRKLGKRNINQVDYYDEKCFKLMKRARPTHEHKEQKRTCKTRACKKTRV